MNSHVAKLSKRRSHAWRRAFLIAALAAALLAGLGKADNARENSVFSDLPSSFATH